MTEIKLSKTETTLLVEAAGRGGALEFPDATKPTSRERMLGRLQRDGLVATGEAGHLLTPAGYRAVGLRAPRGEARSPRRGWPGDRGTGPTGDEDHPDRRSARARGRGEPGRADGRDRMAGAHDPAALSRLRSAGKPLAKSKREDGTTCTASCDRRAGTRTRKRKDEAPAQAAV
jgi:hypothetical protein